MNCMNCGAPIGKSDYCTSCGFHVEVQKKIWQLSNTYYNLGLDKAQIRDLSGAIDLLKRSLKFNKLNVQARNLLGLVYFETGEAVAALSEWIISKNIMPENNIASEYIERLQQNANKLDVINQTIKKYNDSLQCCRKGSEDVAVIQLKKILNQNPKLIKGYHLLALIYLKKEEYENVLDFSVDDERIIKYLKGETLEVEDFVSSKEKGWYLVCVDGYPLGFGKLSGQMLKNKYLPGWRWQSS